MLQKPKPLVTNSSLLLLSVKLADQSFLSLVLPIVVRHEIVNMRFLHFLELSCMLTEKRHLAKSTSFEKTTFGAHCRSGLTAQQIWRSPADFDKSSHESFLLPLLRCYWSIFYRSAPFGWGDQSYLSAHRRWVLTGLAWLDLRLRYAKASCAFGTILSSPLSIASNRLLCLTRTQSKKMNDPPTLRDWSPTAHLLRALAERSRYSRERV